ncbi:MAG: hypothetical protein KAT56_06165 [Sedimentisphaerales bacterium]|nr:hypothetical protein [Sedimentisphaerales bacterium]
MSKGRHEVTFYTYPKYIFCWPLIVMGFVLWFVAPSMQTGQGSPSQIAEPAVVSELSELETTSQTTQAEALSETADSTGLSETLAWVWAITAIVVVVTLGFDLNRNYTVFWLVLIGGSWALILWLRDVKSVKIFSQIYIFFADLDPQYSKPLGLLVSIVLAALYLVMWIWTRLNSKWRITHNEFEHYQFGRMDDSLARGAKRVRTSYPDLFEFLLCMAGDLIIFDSVGRRELRKIPHVPLLPLVKRKINRILEKTAITAGEIEDESDEEGN